MIWNNLELPGSPYYQDKWRTIYYSDNRDILPQLAANCVGSIVTDPPYELGFMGKAWDKSGIAYDLKVWGECLRILKSGGYLLSFGGSRTYHRMACAIEDAGFEIRDMVEWLYGSGFPKSLDIGKAVDKLQGNEREDLGTRQHAKKNFKNNLYAQDPANRNNTRVFGYGMEQLTKGTSEWEGWGTALKPAHEPICMARKPLSEKTVAENVLKYGTGGINIDECRVPTDPGIDDPRLGGKGGWSSDKMAKNVYEGGYAGKRVGSSPLGRFPANLIHDGSQGVMDLFPGQAGAFAPVKRGHDGTSKGIYGNFTQKGDDGETFRGDSGSAARFFYCAKASRSERDEGLEEMPDRDVVYSEYREAMKTTDSYVSKYPDGSPGPMNKLKNTHPTVKPLALMKYLITLITPPNGIILDPFCGSGSTLVAAGELGFISIGIDSDEKSCEIAAKRCSGSSEPPAPP